jgi:UPF0755 protein
VEVNFRRRFLYFAIGVLGSFLALGLGFSYLIYSPTSYVSEENVILERAEQSSRLARQLVDLGIAPNVFLANATIYLMKCLGFTLKSGEYELPAGVSLMGALKILSSGQTVMHKITIPEGFSVAQVMERLDKNKFLLGTVTQLPMEGSLLPDTYLFKYPTTRQHIIKLAQKALLRFIRREWPRRSAGCFLKTPMEVITLASIVEKETSCERQQVAGVFLNRLRQNMKLQSCPTVIYSLKHGWPLGRKLTLLDLQTNSPHNTYQHHGLPPTPISNPGPMSIIAVLHPAATDYLFFVLGRNKMHVFSKTFQEHIRNKRLAKEGE